MNEQTKQKIRTKVESYLKRAEELKKIVKNGPVKKKALADEGSGRATPKGDKDDDDSGDPDRRRMMQKLEGRFYNQKFSILPTSFILGAIIVDSKITFADVIGLEQAKEALKEAVILPVKFPQLFQGIISTIIHLILLYLLFFRKTKTMGWNLTLWSEFFSSSFYSFSSIDFHFSLLVLENLI
jgi:SpoVK/Ycf46/Vps4 family AAA+-type ATPase